MLDHLSSLARLFAWRDARHHDELCAELERTYVDAVVAAVHARLPDDAQRELAAVPDDAYRSIIRGADTFFAERYGRSEDLARSIARWIVVERAVLGDAGSIDQLPRVAGTNIAIDYDGELPERLRARFADRQIVVPSPDERAETEIKLAAAHALLESIAPLAADLVRRMTDVVCCRTSVGDPRFYTASDRSALGVVHLVNTQLSRKTAAELASELVHEAIHQVLFRSEVTAPLLGDRELAAAPVVSPWSGATLDLDGFVHACFVWYGVASLWRLADGVPAAGAYAQVIARERRAAEAGFAKWPLDGLGALATRLPPAVAAIIDQLTRRLAGVRAA